MMAGGFGIPLSLPLSEQGGRWRRGDPLKIRATAQQPIRSKSTVTSSNGTYGKLICPKTLFGVAPPSCNAVAILLWVVIGSWRSKRRDCRNDRCPVKGAPAFWVRLGFPPKTICIGSNDGDSESCFRRIASLRAPLAATTVFQKARGKPHLQNLYGL